MRESRDALLTKHRGDSDHGALQVAVHESLRVCATSLETDLKLLVGQASLHELILDASGSLSVPANARHLTGNQGGDQPFSVSELVSDAEHDALMQAGPSWTQFHAAVQHTAAGCWPDEECTRRRWRGNSMRMFTGSRRRSCTPQSWHSWRHGRLGYTYDARAAIAKLCIPASLSPESSCMAAGSQCGHALSMKCPRTSLELLAADARFNGPHEGVHMQLNMR